MKPLLRDSQLTLVVCVLSDRIEKILQMLLLNATRLDVGEMLISFLDLCFEIIAVVTS